MDGRRGLLRFKVERGCCLLSLARSLSTRSAIRNTFCDSKSSEGAVFSLSLAPSRPVLRFETRSAIRSRARVLCSLSLSLSLDPFCDSKHVLRFKVERGCCVLSRSLSFLSFVRRRFGTQKMVSYRHQRAPRALSVVPRALRHQAPPDLSAENRNMMLHLSDFFLFLF